MEKRRERQKGIVVYGVYPYRMDVNLPLSFSASFHSLSRSFSFSPLEQFLWGRHHYCSLIFSLTLFVSPYSILFRISLPIHPYAFFNSCVFSHQLMPYSDWALTRLSQVFLIDIYIYSHIYIYTYIFSYIHTHIYAHNKEDTSPLLWMTEN